MLTLQLTYNLTQLILEKTKKRKTQILINFFNDFSNNCENYLKNFIFSKNKIETKNHNLKKKNINFYVIFSEHTFCSKFTLKNKK